jgi:hypothetical protein
MEKQSTSDLQTIIHQAEVLKKKMEMEAMFKKNMAFFQKTNPTIYEKFHKYKAKSIWPIFTEEGYVTLVDGKSDRPIYPGDPNNYVKESVEHYEKHSFYRDFNFNAARKTPETEDRSHVIHIAKFMNLAKEYDSERQNFDPLPKDIRFMLLKGIGLGYHIEHLLEKTDIRYLCIVESNPDIFFASLHTVNYDKLFSWFNKSNYGLNLIVEASPDECMSSVLYYLLKIGTYNAVRVYEFDHLDSKEMELASSSIHQGIREAVSSHGFFDDERVGLAHSLRNYQSKYKILEVTNAKYDIPVFICGNGPSLDHAKETLLKYQGQAIIVSSGSCLGALYKMGIKPDFHVENERVKSIHSWIKSSSPREFRKGIQLIALNVVHPEVLNEFDSVVLALKANDLGSTYFKSHQKNEKHPFLMHCNPTVTNTATAIMLTLGFKKIYLFGIDLGFSPDGQHHSKYSQYNEVDSKLFSGDSRYEINSKRNIPVKGNFSPSVITTLNFKNSRDSFDMLFKTYADIDVYNCGEGAFIDGARPMRHTDINLGNIDFDKEKFISTVMKKSFDDDYQTENLEDQVALKNLEPIQFYLQSIKELLAKVSDDKNKNFEILNQIDRLLKILLSDTEHIYRYFLLKGSVYIMMIFLALGLETNASKGIEEFKKGAELLNDFVDDIIRITTQHMLELDHNQNAISRVLEPK